MTKRPCEFCADWDDKYPEEYLTPDTVCGAVTGLRYWISRLVSVVHMNRQSAVVMLIGVTSYTKMIMFIGRMNSERL